MSKDYTKGLRDFKKAMIHPNQEKMPPNAKVRIGNYFGNKVVSNDSDFFEEFFSEELGESPEISSVNYVQGYVHYHWNDFFPNLPDEKFFRAITLVFLAMEKLQENYNRPKGNNEFVECARQFQVFVSKVFKSESVGFDIDNHGNIHRELDFEFEKIVSSTLKILEPPKFDAVKIELINANEALRGGKPNAKQAVVSTYDAVETLFKILFAENNISRISRPEILKRFNPIIEAKYRGHDRAINSSKGMLESFSKWMDAAQQYRHGQKDKEHSPPPSELAALLVSQGASFMRWMVELKG